MTLLFLLRHRLVQCVVVCLLWASLGGGTPVFAAGAVDVSLLNDQPLALATRVEVLADASGTLTVADMQRPAVAARFRPAPDKAEALNYGHTNDHIWLRLQLHNPTDHPLQQMLEVAYARLSRLTLYQLQPGGAVLATATGNQLPFGTRAVDNRYFVFPVSLPPGATQTLYLQAQSSSPLILPLRLWTPPAYQAYERSDYAMQAWYFGMATTMVLFNLLMFVALRERVYLLYVLFSACFVLTLAEENGLAKQFLWGDAPVWSNMATGVGFSLSCGLFLLFMRVVLGTAQALPRLDRLLGLLACVFLLSPIAFATAFDAVIQPAVALWSLTMLLVLWVGLHAAWRHQRIGYFFVAAFTIACAGGVASSFKALGWLPSNVFTVNLLQFGSSIEMLLLALALADRFNSLRDERTLTQQALLRSQQRMLDNLQSQERLLEARVAERTDALQAANQQLAALSTTDGLTGIANRRHFDEVLAREWRRAARLGQPLAVAMLDVDLFKQFNDMYGHQAGDDCLRRIAEVLATHVARTGDLVARYGGEEFVFIAPATDGPSAQGLARTVCAEVLALAIPHASSPTGCVTISIGVAALMPLTGDKAEILVSAADKALYRAKAQGRNRVELAERRTGLLPKA